MNIRSFGAFPIAPDGTDAGRSDVHRRVVGGFSLIEIALALAVAGFTLSALAALLVVVFNSSKSSTDDTLVAGMAGTIINDLRRQYFVDKTPLSPPTYTTPKRPSGGASVLPETNDVATGTQPVAATSIVYFDASGLQLTGPSNAIYMCTETLLGDPTTLGATGSDGSTSNQQVNLLRVTLTFQWPAQVASPPNSKIIHASIARY